MSDFMDYGEALESQSKEIEVAKADDVELAKTYQDACDEKIKEIKEYFAPRKADAKKVHQSWVDAEKESLKPFAAAKAILKKKLSDYQKALDKAVEATGEESLIVSTQAAKRKFWKFRIIDESKIPAEYMAPDEKKIGQVVRDKKGETEIPGVEVYYEY